MTSRSSATVKRRSAARALELIVGVPIILALVVCDAAACAWDEWASDWRALKHWIKEGDSDV